jgi:hypothetical protein
MTKNKGKKQMSNRMKLGLIVMALSMLMLANSECGDTRDNALPTATVQSITGDTTADAIIEDTQDAVETTVGTACALCLAVESAENCTGVCGSE